MMTRVVLASVMVAAGVAEAADVVHVPPAEITAGTQLELVAEAPTSTPTLTLHFRTAGAPAFETLELVRQGDSRWVAVVPAVSVTPPGIEYYLAAGGQPTFASAALPHTIPVTATLATERRARDTIRSEGRRSRIHTSFDWVNYGTRTLGDTRLVDRYYRVDADFSYRLWAYPLEELRVGYTRLIGETEADPGMCPDAPCTRDAGFKVAGWFELGLALVEGLRIDGRLSVAATQSGFQPGTRFEGRLGVREASHIALGFEYLADVGASGFFRLGWGTVPKLPMSATVEVTNLPASHREAGVRLYYDLAHALDNGFRIGLRLGYAARVQQVAGFTGGASASVDF